jgi:hypothetical protein
MQTLQTVNLFMLRVAAIQNFLVYIDGKRCNYAELLTIKGIKFYTLVKQDLREIRVTSNCPDSVPIVTIIPDRQKRSYKRFKQTEAYKRRYKKF